MSIYRLENWDPQIHPTAYIAPGAVVVGRVEIGAGASVWFGAVIRADVERIVVGPGSNIQDGAILHADPGEPCLIAASVTVGHRAVVHGCQIEEGALIGMGAVVLNRARVGVGAVVGAGAVVAAGTEIPAGMLAVGIPAKVSRPMEVGETAARYQALAQRYRDGLHAQQPQRRYQITLSGQEALNPFSDRHMALRRDHSPLLQTLRAVADKRFEGLDTDHLQTLLREGLIQIA
jgi:carbonic anhydrase/acetyltransferase-like protein (isoleucine patch superfamily)